MNAKQFQAKVTDLYKKHNLIKDNNRHTLQTVFGTFYFNCEWIPRIKVANIHSGLFPATKEQRQRFKDLSGYHIDVHNGKCNFYSSDCEWILDTLEEYLDNITWLESGEKQLKTEETYYILEDNIKISIEELFDIIDWGAFEE